MTKNGLAHEIPDSPATMPAITFLSVGTLDDTSWVKPQVQLWCESVQSWVRLSEETRNFPRGMTA